MVMARRSPRLPPCREAIFSSTLNDSNILFLLYLSSDTTP
jgi:hypothetical protein